MLKARLSSGLMAKTPFQPSWILLTVNILTLYLRWRLKQTAQQYRRFMYNQHTNRDIMRHILSFFGLATAEQQLTLLEKLQQIITNYFVEHSFGSNQIQETMV